MPSNEHREQDATRSVYDSCDPVYLRKLREEAGIDLVALARTACLSLAQVRQLESSDSDNLFYSDAIKRQAYKRLLMILGAEPPTVEVPQALRDAHQVAEAHLNTLDQIVAMSHQPMLNRTASDVVRSSANKVIEHKQMLGAFLLLAIAVALLVFQVPQKLEVLNSQVAATVVAPASEVIQPIHVPEPVASAAVQPVSLPVASAPTLSASAPSVVASVATFTPVVTQTAASAASGSSKTCAFTTDVIPQLTPLISQKEGRYVYLMSSANVEICVVDGNKQATILQLKAGENRSVYGVSPWQLSGSNLQKVQIYFQGGRVSLPDNAATRVKLVEVPVAH
jgi:hypothetical protein